MSEAFFENPIYVYLALGLAALVLAVIWHEGRSKRVALAIIVPVVLAVVVAVVERAVVTDREQIANAAQAIADAVGSGQFDEIRRHIDDQFLAQLRPYGGGYTKQSVVEAVKRDVTTHGVTKVSIGRTEIEVTGRQATMHVQTMIHFGGADNQTAPFIWDIGWIKCDDGWKVLEVISFKQGIEL